MRGIFPIQGGNGRYYPNENQFGMIWFTLFFAGIFFLQAAEEQPRGVFWNEEMRGSVIMLLIGSVAVWQLSSSIHSLTRTFQSRSRLKVSRDIAIWVTILAASTFFILADTGRRDVFWNEEMRYAVGALLLGGALFRQAARWRHRSRSWEGRFQARGARPGRRASRQHGEPSRVFGRRRLQRRNRRFVTKDILQQGRAVHDPVNGPRNGAATDSETR